MVTSKTEDYCFLECETVLSRVGVITDGVCIDHLYTRLVNTSSYSATANLYNSQITTAPNQPFPACCVFTSRFLATASNSRDSQLHALRFYPHSRPRKTNLNSQLSSLFIKSQHGRHRKHRSSTVACMLRQLPSNTESPLSNGSIRHSIT
jgi:hypothetical protein